MPEIYAMSDIHGYYDVLETNLKSIDLTIKDNKLILCGDYIDYGPDSCKVLYRIKALVDKYPEQVIVLMGNHEYMFLEVLSLHKKDIQVFEWLSSDKGFSTISTFVSEETKHKVESLKKVAMSINDFYEKSFIIMKDDIFKNHNELIKWLKGLPFYYETDDQIFVHAGIDEEAEEYWKYGTTEESFVSKYPVTTGSFYKDIIAGHVSTETISGNKDFHDIFYDNASHFYIDGSVDISHRIPILKIDSDSRKYFSIQDNGEELRLN